MQERSGTFFGVVLSVVLTVLIGVNPAHVQTTSTADVDVTFPDMKSQLLLTGQLYRPDASGPFPAVVVLPGYGESKQAVGRQDRLRRHAEGVSRSPPWV
jgi:hypothetical protein